MNAELSRQLKSLAARERKTFTALVEEGAALLLAQRRRPRKRKRVVLPTFRGNGLQPGIDLTDNVAVRDRMDDGLPLERRR
jgi:hypothetical protein